MIFSAPIYNDVLNSIWGRYEQIFLMMVASVKNWVNKTRRLIKVSALSLKLANIQKRYTSYSFLKCLWKVLYSDIGFHEMPIYCSWRAISFVRLINYTVYTFIQPFTKILFCTFAQNRITLKRNSAILRRMKFATDCAKYC